MNLLNFCGAGLDWRHLLTRLGGDAPLLAGVLCLLKWLSPDRVREFPSWLLCHLGLGDATEAAKASVTRQRAGLLNPKDWFGPPFSDKTVMQRTARD